MFKTKKLMSIALASAIFIASLAGCSPAATNDGGGGNIPATVSSSPTNVIFWTISPRQNAVEAIVREFNELNVTAAFYDTDGIKDACKVAASSGTLPHMWFNWGGSLAGFYSDNGLTYDLTEYAEENDWDSIFDPGVLSLTRRNGQLMGYPTSYNIISVYYRKDIFDSINLSVPTTFEEFEALCEVLKENDITPISTADLNGWYVMRFVELLIGWCHEII